MNFNKKPSTKPALDWILSAIIWFKNFLNCFPVCSTEDVIIFWGSNKAAFQIIVDPKGLLSNNFVTTDIKSAPNDFLENIDLLIWDNILFF